MKKTITVTPEILEHLHPYQGQANKMPAIGEILHVHGNKIPKVRTNGYFVQVTNWKPSANSLYLLNDRPTEPDADKYGWDNPEVLNLLRQRLEEKKEIALFQRWSIDYNFVK